jgi:hypothetical protein
MTEAGDELVVVQVAANEPEAELICSLLRSADIECLSQVTNQGAGAGDGLAVGGAHAVRVPQRDAEDAREILRGAAESP